MTPHAGPRPARRHEALRVPLRRPAVRTPLARRGFCRCCWRSAVTAHADPAGGQEPAGWPTNLIVLGAFGSWDRVIVGLNKTDALYAVRVGVALCFRGNVINIGAEGQIAIGGLAASCVALVRGGAAALGAAAARRARRRRVRRRRLGGDRRSDPAAARRARSARDAAAELRRSAARRRSRCTARMGEDGAGFPQTPLFDASSAGCRSLSPGTDLHVGIVHRGGRWPSRAHRSALAHRPRLSLAACVGASAQAAHYAGISPRPAPCSA